MSLEEQNDMRAILLNQSSWSYWTFGPGPRTEGLVKHITKELDEIKNDPKDLSEWIDVAILAFDGAWRTGATPQQIVDAYKAKMAKNQSRQWPDWRNADPNAPIEHVKGIND
jgi:hypothetical protein